MVLSLILPSSLLCATDVEEALHEAELQQREALLGPNHPQLADSLSNMAILYSQSGNHDKALPLYERALKIYEAAYGPNDPNVAHTLTDIAVLHLEQVIKLQADFSLMYFLQQRTLKTTQGSWRKIIKTAKP